MEEPAMPVGPVHHGCNAEAPRAHVARLSLSYQGFPDFSRCLVPGHFLLFPAIFPVQVHTRRTFERDGVPVFPEGVPERRTLEGKGWEPWSSASGRTARPRIAHRS